MEFNEVVGAVSTVGFPIVISLLFYWQSVKTTEKLTEIIENNTKAIVELKEKIENKRGE